MLIIHVAPTSGLHKKDVRVTGDVRHTKDWGHLMLPWCHLRTMRTVKIYDPNRS